MKPQITKDTCIGCGMCASILPHVYTMDDQEGKAYVTGNPDASEKDLVEDSIISCPTQSISL